MTFAAKKIDRFGLVHPLADAHTLGISAVQQILTDCGYATFVADAPTCLAFGTPEAPGSTVVIERWLLEHRITVLGFSYRLDPADGARIFSTLVRRLKARGLLAAQGGRLRWRLCRTSMEEPLSRTIEA